MLSQISDNVDAVANLGRLPRERGKQSIIRRLMSTDVDVESGSHVVSLRCPISQTRINTPCRSSKCQHYQCFDAKSWLQFVELQAGDNKCPICNVTIISQAELIVDGYFDEILKSIPSTIFEVLIDTHGEWRTKDGKYSSLKRAASRVRETHPSPQLGALSCVRLPNERGSIVGDSQDSVIEGHVVPHNTLPPTVLSIPPPAYTHMSTSPYALGAHVDSFGHEEWTDGPRGDWQSLAQRYFTVDTPYDSSQPVIAHPAWLGGIYGLLLLLGLIEVCDEYLMGQ
ncbi:SUMO ligase siz1 [Ceratobasidium sp. 428]|nr:SUMO ligase siz1 [Ceratobasidium sp. 428]